MNPKPDPYATALHRRIDAFLIVCTLLIIALVLCASADADTANIRNGWENDDWWAQRAATRFAPSHQFALHSTHPGEMTDTIGAPDTITASPSIWNGAGANDNWTTAANWVGNNTPVPGVAYDLQFAGSTRLTANNDFAAGSNFRNLTFNSGAGAFILGGNSIILNGGVGNNSTSLQTITFNIATTAVRTFTMGLGDITVGMSGDPTKGVISGIGGGIILSGAGVLTLWGNNTYTGNTFIGATSQTLNINSATALGSGTLVFNAGGTFDNTSGAAITLTNNNAIALGASPPTFTGTNDLSFGTGAVSLGTTSSGSNRTLTVTNSGATLTLNGLIGNGSGGLNAITKAGAGTLALGGANSFTGTVKIEAGALSVSNVGNSGANSNLGRGSSIQIGNLSATGTLRYTGSGETSNKAISLAGSTGGAVIDQSGTGLLKFTSDFTITTNGAKTVTLQGSTAGTGEIAGAIVNSTSATSVAKSGTGRWTLSGPSTYTGATTINGGTLALDNNNTTTARLANTSAITVNSGGTLLLTQSGGTASMNRINNAATVTINGGGTFNTGGLNEGPTGGTSGATAAMGALTLNANSTIDFTSANSSNLLFLSLIYTPGDAVTVANWTGTLLTDDGSATNDRLLFVSSTGLTDAQLASFQFTDDTGALLGIGATEIAFNGYFELVPVPVPEPGTWFAATLAFGVLAYTQRRRLSACVSG